MRLPDGKLKASGQTVTDKKDEHGNPVLIDKINFAVPHSDESDGKPRCFWIGYSYDDKRSFDGMMGEIRVWNKVLTAEEINAKDHFYKIDPASEGLVSYWKFNDNNTKDRSSRTIRATASTWKRRTMPTGRTYRFPRRIRQSRQHKYYSLTF